LGHLDKNRKPLSGNDSVYSNQEGGIEVLLIEDDPLIAKAMKILFEQAKIRLYSAQTCEEAIAQVQTGIRPDVIVSDYRLPGCNGIDAVKEIRGLVLDTIPAIIITGDTSLQQIEDENLAKCTVFLKPVDAQKLVKTVLELTQILQ
jgi:DNA-binding NtrC family response regulator